MSHNNYIYKRNHWQLHSKKVIQKERYPWLSYQSLCRIYESGVLVFWTSRCGLGVRLNLQETPRHVLPRWPDRFCMGWLGQLHRVAFACLCAWDVSLGASGVRVVLCFFFLGETTEKQNLWFKCFFRQFACVVRFTTTIYNYVCLWSFALNFFWSSQKAGGIPSHPTSCHQKPNSFSLHDITSQFPTHVSFHTKRNKHIKSLKW